MYYMRIAINTKMYKLHIISDWKKVISMFNFQRDADGAESKSMKVQESSPVQLSFVQNYVFHNPEEQVSRKTRHAIGVGMFGILFRMWIFR